MNATTSRFGLLTDPPIVAIATAPFLLATLAAMRLDASHSVQTALEAMTAAPLAIALFVAILLRSARSNVVRWLATVPFAVENMNLILNGAGESMEITFSGKRPVTPNLNMALEIVSPDAFVTLAPDGSEEPTDGVSVVEVRLGIVESKSNPAGSNHQRYLRVRALIDKVLVPLADEYPIARVRMR